MISLFLVAPRNGKLYGRKKDVYGLKFSARALMKGKRAIRLSIDHDPKGHFLVEHASSLKVVWNDQNQIDEILVDLKIGETAIFLVGDEKDKIFKLYVYLKEIHELPLGKRHYEVVINRVR